MQLGVASDQAVANHCVFVIVGCEVSRAALQFMLQDEYETHEWRGLSQALAGLRERRPDVAIVEIADRGDVDARVLDRIREASAQTRIVVLVGSADGPEGARWLTAGAHGVLSRPLTVEAVRRKVRLALGLRAAIGIAVEAG